MAEVQTQPGASSKDTALLIVSIVAILSGIVAFYWYDELPLPARVGMVVVGVAVGAGLAWFSSYGREFLLFGQAAFASSGTERIEGIPAISEFWAQRGKRNTHHVIKIEGISGNEWFAEGEVSVDDSETRMFLTHVTFNDQGQIERFVALR